MTSAIKSPRMPKNHKPTPSTCWSVRSLVFPQSLKNRKKSAIASSAPWLPSKNPVALACAISWTAGLSDDDPDFERKKALMKEIIAEKPRMRKDYLQKHGELPGAKRAEAKAKAAAKALLQPSPLPMAMLIPIPLRRMDQGPNAANDEAPPAPPKKSRTLPSCHQPMLTKRNTTGHSRWIQMICHGMALMR